MAPGPQVGPLQARHLRAVAEHCPALQYFRLIGFKVASRTKHLVIYYTLRGTPALHLNEPAGRSCCGAGLGLVWYCYCVFLKFICLTKKMDLFWTFEGLRVCRIQK